MSHVPASANGGNGWNEAGADQSHSQLYCHQIQPLWERHKGESPVRYFFCSFMNNWCENLGSSLGEQDCVREIMASSSTGFGGIDWGPTPQRSVRMRDSTWSGFTKWGHRKGSSPWIEHIWWEGFPNVDELWSQKDGRLITPGTQAFRSWIPARDKGQRVWVSSR